MDPRENRVAANARQDLQQLNEDLSDFDAYMASEGVEPKLRERLKRWWEERIGGRTLSLAERALRGIRGEN